jgi:hypothetical protein
MSLRQRAMPSAHRRAVARTVDRFRRLGMSICLVTMMVAALGVASATPAVASTGGGCQDTYSGFGEVSGCISASGSHVLPDGYVDWTTIPPNCSIGLFLQNASHVNVARANYPCGQDHYGPFSVAEPSGTTWYSVMIVYSGLGNVEADSRPEHLSY